MRRVGPQVRRLAALPLCLGCVEYGIAPKPDDPLVPVDTDTDVVVVDTAPDTVPPPTCADATLTVGSWVASPTFTGADDPVDGLARPFHDPTADVSGWSPVTPPDRNAIPQGSDRAYRLTVDVTGTPPRVVMDLQSDDGLTVWIDGQRVGQWGGQWQQEGCVNDAAECIETIAVPPIDVSTWLTEGSHVVALRVSNPVAGSYADVRPRCVESP
ncbi:MAG: hypothetical protein H6733_16680 [Alphaproteobacteria bacterium]|nr:hypothetical protein [Alphaproteobacteria bacterium]